LVAVSSIYTVNVSTGFFAFILALAAGVPAAAQSAPQPPAQPASQQPPAGQPPATPPVAQPPAAPVPGAPATAAPAVPASRKFTSDAGVIFNVIKPDKVADFELVLARVKEALGKSQDPKRKQQALSWRVFKGLEAGPGGNVVYLFFMDPATKEEDYSVTTILTEAFPSEAQDLWAKYTACFVSGQVMLNLATTINMSPTAAPIPK
jgi:pyruvate/2-oxoglutarate dehydrogenase complex dihydrolipoamide acyltransferase (E2) component